MSLSAKAAAKNPLLDHLVGASEHGRRNFKLERGFLGSHDGEVVELGQNAGAHPLTNLRRPIASVTSEADGVCGLGADSWAAVCLAVPGAPSIGPLWREAVAEYVSRSQSGRSAKGSHPFGGSCNDF